jgi:hypothetical protein
MIFFIFTLFLMFSLSAILYLMVRALPRIAESTLEPAAKRRSFLDRWAHSEIPEKIDATFNSFLLKFLRKFKVSILKLDNLISTHLRKIRHEETVNDKKIDFKEISEQNKED